MRVADFDLDALPRSTKQGLTLEVTVLPDGSPVTLPVLVARGGSAGPALLVLAGVHGDEYEGMRAIWEVYGQLDPAHLHGTFLAVPVANGPAFAAGTRESPIDHKNLARVFPGSPDGSVTDRIAHALDQYLIARADFLLDLHSAGAKYTMATLVGYYHDSSQLGQISQQAAFSFGAPVVWGHPSVGPGRTISAAMARGIPWLYAETTGGGWVREHDVQIYTRGVQNLLKHLKMLPGAPDAPSPSYHFVGDGNTDKAITAQASGYLVPAVQLLEKVAPGD
ncbi:MAG: succinylglutamate desuccinylase/aspartoacylase family protein, partial [Deinococcus sp.]|nr:succinylglutamate desuccinylase/aspartoacylase family protein [Deinococcus sp.]